MGMSRLVPLLTSTFSTLSPGPSTTILPFLPRIALAPVIRVRAPTLNSALAKMLVLMLALLLGAAALAAAEVPRFSSLRFDRVNVRVGPGPNFPIEWVFTRRNMPVEVIAEYEAWRRIRDWQG